MSECCGMREQISKIELNFAWLRWPEFNISSIFEFDCVVAWPLSHSDRSIWHIIIVITDIGINAMHATSRNAISDAMMKLDKTTMTTGRRKSNIRCSNSFASRKKLQLKLKSSHKIWLWQCKFLHASNPSIHLSCCQFEKWWADSIITAICILWRIFGFANSRTRLLSLTICIWSFSFSSIFFWVFYL